MDMTAAEKIFAAHAGRDHVRAGEFVIAQPDRILLNDVSGPFAFAQLRAMGANRVADPDRIVLVGDHFAPPKDEASSLGLRLLEDFAATHGIRNSYGIGDGGIEHTLLPELGLVGPGQLVIGGDSHTCTYGAVGGLGTGMGSTDIAAAMALGEAWFRVPPTIRFVLSGKRRRYVAGKDIILQILRDIRTDGATYACMEFVGPGLAGLSVDDRMAVCNMSAEGGAKTCIVPADDVTVSWVGKRMSPVPEPVASDANAEFAASHEYELGAIEPLCAQPYSPDNVLPVKELKGIKVDQVYVGNCANGTLTDLRQAAEILKGRKVRRTVRCIIVPATQSIHRQAVREGLIDVFLEAGAIVGPSTCGACAGLHMGVLSEGMTAVATINRNYRGRMGSAAARTFLANAYVAAASAVAGELISPEEVAE